MGVQDWTTTMKLTIAIFSSLLFALAKSQQLSDEFCSAVKSGKTKARCCFNMVFTHTEVDLASSSVTCTPKNKKIKSLKKLFSGTSGFSFQMTLAVNMGKTGSSIKSAEIKDAPITTTTTTTTTTSTTAKSTTTEFVPGDWIVVQHRGQHGNPADTFAKTFAEYEAGFTVGEEFWLGLRKLAELTQEGEWELKVELSSWGKLGGKTATYSDFSVGPAPRFQLNVGKARMGSRMVDALRYSSGAAFSAKDKDQDQWTGNCSKRFGSAGWWFKSCFWSNLNGMNAATGLRRGTGIQWGRLQASATTLSIRRVA